MTTPRTHSAPAPAPPPPRAGGALGRLVTRAFAPFWVVPALWCAGAFVVGLTLPEADEQLAEHVPFLFQAGPDGARSFLSTIAGAMISVTGLVFSITMVVLQLASSQFSPRVLRTFLDQRTPQHTLGVFTASFVYALTVMRSVGADGSASTDVPQLAVTVAFLMVLASVGMFLAFIHHITQAISVDTIVREITDDTRDLLHRRATGRRTVTGGPGETLPDLGAPRVVTAKASAYLDGVDLLGLCEVAAERNVRLAVLHPLGTFVVEGSPVVLVHGGGRAPDVDWDRLVHRRLALRWRRSTEQDVTFGLRQLVDIGERALSPGVNDPTTAVQVIDALHALLAELVSTDDLSPVVHDEHGVPRVVTTDWAFRQVLDLCVDELAHWGASSLQVPERLDGMLTQLAEVATPQHRPVVEAKRVHVQQVAAGAS